MNDKISNIFQKRDLMSSTMHLAKDQHKVKEAKVAFLTDILYQILINHNKILILINNAPSAIIRIMTK